jgi:hypothetical protein
MKGRPRRNNEPDPNRDRGWIRDCVPDNHRGDEALLQTRRDEQGCRFSAASMAENSRGESNAPANS